MARMFMFAKPPAVNRQVLNATQYKMSSTARPCRLAKEGCVFMRADIAPGAVFPDYELTDHTGKRRKLSDLQGPDPMILVLSRGGFCPKARRQAEGLVELDREMEVGYCCLVTISTDTLMETNEYRTGIGAHRAFLSECWTQGAEGSGDHRVHRCNA